MGENIWRRFMINCACSRIVFVETYDSPIFTYLTALCWKLRRLNNRDEILALY